MKKTRPILSVIVAMGILCLLYESDAAEKTQTSGKAPAEKATVSPGPTKAIKGKAKGSPGSTKTIKGKTPRSRLSQKAKELLKDIEDGKSFEAIAKAYKNTKFTKAEIRQLENEINKSRYATKLRNMTKKPKGYVKSKSKGRDFFMREKQAFQKKQERELAQINKQARSKMSKFKSKQGPSTRTRIDARARDIIPRTPKTSMMGGVTPPHEEIPGSIHSLSGDPSPLIWGRSTTIHGEGFGTRQGRVGIVFEPGGVVSYCAVTSWNDTEIAINIYSGYFSGVSDPFAAPYLSGRDCAVWVKLPGIDNGPSIHGTLIPSRPIILSTSSDEIRPGQELLIEGVNFWNRRGSVSFSLRPYRSGFILPAKFECGIIEWTDTAILISVPWGIDRVLRQTTTLQLVNSLEIGHGKSVTFVPGTQITTVRQEEELEATVLWFVGHYECHDFHSANLQNDWVVESAWKDSSGWGPGYGSNYKTRATVGSSRTYTRIEYWADAFSHVDVASYVIIRGPLGTEHGVPPRWIPW